MTAVQALGKIDPAQFGELGELGEDEGAAGLDEEAIDLMTLQRQFQAAARSITVIDEAMQVLLSTA